MINTDKPWISGPKELLIHGIDHLELNTGFDCRIAMISIDNSVELMIKTYLGLPKRITGINGLSRKKLEDITSTFPNLLDGLEEYANEKLKGIELGDIEWFHRLRNQLYHDGNGITVEKEKVEAYAEIAKILFENFFGVNIEQDLNRELKHSLVGEFLSEWAKLEKLTLFEGKYKIYSPMRRFRQMQDNGDLTLGEFDRLNDLRKFRNDLVHGMTTPSKRELQESIKEIKFIQEKLS